jgi:hypothetical protein
MIAILTKFIGPTNYRGARVKAYTTSGHRIVVPWDHALNVEENHDAAALALCRKMEWGGKLVRGSTEVGYAYAFLREWTVIDAGPEA